MRSLPARIREGIAYWAWRIGSTLAQRVPTRIGYPVAVLFGEVAYLFWSRKRRVAKRNFAVVLARPTAHPDVARTTRRSFRNFAKYVLEIMRFPSLRMEDFHRLVTVDGWEHLRGALERGRGVIFVSIHFGNFEFGGARIASDIPLNVVWDEIENARLMQVLVGNRAHKGVTLMPSEGAAKRVLRALRRNELVGLMMDLGPRAQEFDNVEATFFGTPTSFPSAAASLARVSGAPIIVTAVVRQHDNTFRGVALPPIFVERTKQAANDVQGATQAIAHLLEGFVRRWPDQWYIFRPMWPALPEPAP